MAVVFDDFSFAYDGAKKKAISNISLEIEAGEFVVLVGNGGSRKSTLLHAINGVIPGFEKGRLTGNVLVEGLDTQKVRTIELTKFVGIVFQNSEMQFFTTTVEEELALALENMGVEKNIILERITWALDIIGMKDYRHRPLYALSGGQKQLIAIASVLVMQQKILLLDEPTANLDPAGSRKVYSVFEEIRQELGVTIILIDHKIDMILAAMGTNFRMIGLKDGEVIADGSSQDILCDIALVDKIGLKTLDTVLLYHALAEKGIATSPFLTVDKAVHEIIQFGRGGEQNV